MTLGPPAIRSRPSSISARARTRPPPSWAGGIAPRWSVRKEHDMEQTCEHLNSSDDTPAGTSGCEECLQMGDDWVHLRRCLRCGHVGCCDSSKNRHATKHF